jgi:hypothetical protein
MYVVRWYKEILLVETFRKEWSFWNIKATIIFILCNMHMVTQSGEDGQSWNTPLRPWRPGKPVVIWVPISITMTAYRWLLTSVEIAGFQESCGAEQRGGTFRVYLCLLMNCWANLEQTDAWTGPFFQCPSPLPAQPLYLPWGAPHQGCKRCDMISLNYAPLPCVSWVELTHQEDLSLSYLGRWGTDRTRSACQFLWWEIGIETSIVEP